VTTTALARLLGMLNKLLTRISDRRKAREQDDVRRAAAALRRIG
jgi:hypothetical protein